MKRIRIGKLIIIYCLAIISVCACNNAQLPNLDELSEQEIDITPTSEINSGYPAPINSTKIDDSYPITTEVNIQMDIDEITKLPEAKKPADGKTSLSCVLYSYSMNQLIPNTSFYLSPAIGEENSFPPIMAGPNPEQGDINGFSDKNAVIILNDIEPGNYYLIVWAPNTWGFAVNDAKEEKPLMLQLSEGKAHNYDVILVQWP